MSSWRLAVSLVCAYREPSEAIFVRNERIARELGDDWAKDGRPFPMGSMQLAGLVS